MRYIRTKDGRIIDCVKLLKDAKKNKLKNEDDIALAHYLFNMKTTSIGWKRRVEKVADSIEELCDEFVFVDEFGKKDLLDDDYKAKLQESGTFSVVHALMEQDRPKELYGAVWTGKGLIYVAKMNEKMEFELL